MTALAHQLDVTSLRSADLLTEEPIFGAVTFTITCREDGTFSIEPGSQEVLSRDTVTFVAPRGSSLSVRIFGCEVDQPPLFGDDNKPYPISSDGTPYTVADTAAGDYRIELELPVISRGLELVGNATHAPVRATINVKRR